MVEEVSEIRGEPDGSMQMLSQQQDI